MTDDKLTIDPVRLCCGKRHYGAVCPDGKVQCCLCFARFEIADLNLMEDGTAEDVCRACAEKEEAAWTTS